MTTEVSPPAIAERIDRAKKRSDELRDAHRSALRRVHTMVQDALLDDTSLDPAFYSACVEVRETQIRLQGQVAMLAALAGIGHDLQIDADNREEEKP